MAIKNDGANSSKKKEEVISVWELLSRVWSLDYEITLINKNYSIFHKNMTWSRYGEIIMLKDRLLTLIEDLKKLEEKIEKGARE